MSVAKSALVICTKGDSKLHLTFFYSSFFVLVVLACKLVTIGGAVPCVCSMCWASLESC